MPVATAILLVVLLEAAPAFADEGGAGRVMAGPPTPSYANSLRWAQDWGGHVGAFHAAAWSVPADSSPDTGVMTAEIGRAPTYQTTSSVYAWGIGRWRFASLISASYALQPASPDVAASAWDDRWQDHAYGAAAVALAPVVASYRINQTDRIAFSLGITRSAEHVQNGRRGNPSLNVWSLTPKLAYTQVIAGSDPESSTILAVATFSRKALADYQNGAVGRIEMLAMKQTPSGWGYGGVAAALEQWYRDPGTVADRTAMSQGAQGLALGLGPQISWHTRWQGGQLELQCRWIYEFRAPNGHVDQPLLLSVTLHP